MVTFELSDDGAIRIFWAENKPGGEHSKQRAASAKAQAIKEQASISGEGRESEFSRDMHPQGERPKWCYRVSGTRL